MKKFFLFFRLSIGVASFLWFAAAMLFSTHAFAQIAVITQVTGDVNIRDAKGGNERSARLGEVVTKGDSIQTPEKGGLQLLFSNGNLLQLSEKTRVRLTEYEFDRPTQGDHSVTDVQSGEARFLTSNDYSAERRSAVIKTPNMTVMTDDEAKGGGDLYIKVEAKDKGTTEVVSLDGAFVVGSQLEKRKVPGQEKIKSGQSTRNKTAEELAENAEKPFAPPTDLDTDRITSIQSVIVKPANKVPFNIYKENHPNFAERFKPRAYIHMKNRIDAKKRRKK